MKKEFLTELKKNCDIHGIDIDILCDVEVQLIYNGTAFDVQCYEDYNGKSYVQLSIVNMTIRGEEYNCFVDIDFPDAYDTVNDAVMNVIDVVLRSDHRRKVLKIINSFESFIEDMLEDDLEILVSYIKNKYN